MRIAVLGTGMVGQALAVRLAELGHQVVLGTRDVSSTLDRVIEGGETLAQWLEDRPSITVAGMADAAGAGDVVVNATSGRVTLEALSLAGAENLAGKVLIDLSNPLDFSDGFPPSLFVKDVDSLGEQVQAAFPKARVVKTLNTLTAALMAHPELLGEPHTVFVSGNDASAKQVVRDLLASLGHADVIDLGDIGTSRGVEMYLPLWLRTMGALGTGVFNIKVVR